MPQIGQSNVLSPGQPATHCYSAKSKFSSGQFPFSPLPQASTEVINKIYKAPRRALFPGETTKGQSHRKPLSAARMPLYQPHLTLMIVFFFFFFVLHSKKQFIFSVISEQDALLSCFGLFQIIILACVSNPLQWPKPKKKKKCRNRKT